MCALCHTGNIKLNYSQIRSNVSLLINNCNNSCAKLFICSRLAVDITYVQFYIDVKCCLVTKIIFITFLHLDTKITTFDFVSNKYFNCLQNHVLHSLVIIKCLKPIHFVISIYVFENSVFKHVFAIRNNSIIKQYIIRE